MYIYKHDAMKKKRELLAPYIVSNALTLRMDIIKIPAYIYVIVASRPGYSSTKCLMYTLHAHMCFKFEKKI